jgi:hypothetical protein
VPVKVSSHTAVVSQLLRSHSQLLPQGSTIHVKQQQTTSLLERCVETASAVTMTTALHVTGL